MSEHTKNEFYTYRKIFCKVSGNRAQTEKGNIVNTGSPQLVYLHTQT